jgi:hypothetical protein
LKGSEMNPPTTTTPTEATAASQAPRWSDSRTQAVVTAAYLLGLSRH